MNCPPLTLVPAATPGQRKGPRRRWCATGGLPLVAAGLPNKRIAARPGVSLQTVKLHRGRLMRKVQLDSVAELVRVAERAGSLPPGH